MVHHVQLDWACPNIDYCSHVLMLMSEIHHNIHFSTGSIGTSNGNDQPLHCIEYILKWAMKILIIILY